MADNQTGQERREYFRIKNWIIINHDTVNNIEDIPQFDDLTATSSPRISLLQELTKLENENLAYLSSLTDKQSQLGSYLINLNKKMELLTHFVIQSLNTGKDDLTEVDISGGGIRYKTHQRFSVDQLMKIEIVLVPECIGIVAYARVVDCKPIDDDNFEIALIFVKLKEADRDSIIKHVFKVQSKQLRNQQENLDPN
ncbi:PilZ domain-containing protein [Aliikangiella sp. IMCC44359]|uniref:PilZ domain-containing protein n=1 Tax=Aliikangiella sp. IMCC44359 TaxID=3459125 RepID=UPI00403A8274